MDTLNVYTGKPLHTIQQNSSMIEACRKMKKEKIRHLIVLDFSGNLTGILSDRDIQRSIHQLKINEFDQLENISPTEKVNDYMTWPVCTLYNFNSIETAAKEMIKQQISSLVILNKDGRPEGIVTSEDIMELFLQDHRKIKSRNSLLQRLSSWMIGQLPRKKSNESFRNQA